jgi:ArsR family transcriptional regulator
MATSMLIETVTRALARLATHEREKLRQRHAHARLGFSDEQMLEWLTGSGFAPS